MVLKGVIFDLDIRPEGLALERVDQASTSSTM